MGDTQDLVIRSIQGLRVRGERKILSSILPEKLVKKNTGISVRFEHFESKDSGFKYLIVGEMRCIHDI